MLVKAVFPVTLIIAQFLLSSSVFSQNAIQWASGIKYQQNAFQESGEWSGSQALGKPDALPQGQLSPKAFRLNEKGAFGTIILTYQDPIEVDFLIISENLNPGRIIEVFLYDESGKRYPAYVTVVTELKQISRVLIIDIPPTNYKVTQLELNLNSISNPGWSQIDAVGISHSTIKEIKKEIDDQGLINIGEEFGFMEPRERLGPEINTSYDENKSIISPDGNTLYFIRNEYPQNIGGKRDLQDIYISTIDNTEWATAKNAGPDLNNKYPNGVNSVSPDGNVLYLINNYNKRGLNPGGLSYSFRTSTGWTGPEAVNMDNFYNRNVFEDHQVASGGRILISSIERNDSYGDLDLYISFLEDAVRWSIPINLGPVINTSKSDYSPFLAPDGRTLYFASNGRGGFGRSDIFFSRRLDESWINWSEPQNMGSAVNTKTTDAYYTVSAKGDYGYFVSRAGSKNGSKDIFRIKLPSGVAPEPVLLVKGHVFDQKTGKPIGAKILFETISDDFDKGTAMVNPISGEYTMVLSRGKIYGYRAEMEGYFSVNENVDLTSFNAYKEINRDLYLVPIEAGQTVRLNNLFFKQASSDLLTESFDELERWVKILTEYPQMVIELGGHTDNQGDKDANKKLSKERVGTVKKYLVRRGINQNRLPTVGYGDTKPLNDNSSEELRSVNRRVEITIIKT